ncbi:hypothetical protein HELRODRAFT_177080 [Helobdella robusta]|uniref:SAP domain-containing protein n=1 Tax=Helobdella robusta TaxID=6412 RepID=T1FB75_HELRO|nr:hypothetical protein HELRODRAFT_177080 [Helobdella robusta]ESN98213.1 hypothetical protein HELRODRAFT_177080 [Helobdella robusta]
MPALEKLNTTSLQKELRQKSLDSKEAKTFLTNRLSDALIKATETRRNCSKTSTRQKLVMLAQPTDAPEFKDRTKMSIEGLPHQYETTNHHKNGTVEKGYCKIYCKRPQKSNVYQGDNTEKTDLWIDQAPCLERMQLIRQKSNDSQLCGAGLSWLEKQTPQAVLFMSQGCIVTEMTFG